MYFSVTGIVTVEYEPCNIPISRCTWFTRAGGEYFTVSGAFHTVLTTEIFACLELLKDKSQLMFIPNLKYENMYNWQSVLYWQRQCKNCNCFAATKLAGDRIFTFQLETYGLVSQSDRVRPGFISEGN